MHFIDPRPSEIAFFRWSFFQRKRYLHIEPIPEPVKIHFTGSRGNMEIETVFACGKHGSLQLQNDFFR